MERYESYKGSGVEWIGEIPKEWAVKKLKYILSISNGEGIKSEEIKDFGDYPVYGGNGLVGYTTEFNNDDDVFVIGRVGAKCGNIRFISGKKWISDNALLAYASGNSKYIEFFMTALDLNKLANKNAQPLITSSMIKEQYIFLPPQDEQAAIANYLDRKTAEIDALIAQKQRLIELYQEEKTAIINQAVTQGVAPNVTFKDTGINWLGEIPEGWEIKKLKYETYKIGDGIHTTPNYISGTGIFFINGMNLSGRKISITENTLSVPIGEYEKYKIDLNVGSILISLNGTIGNLAIYNGEKVIFGKSAAYIEIKEKIYNLFLYYALQTQYVLNYFEDSFSGTTIKNLSLHTLRNTPLPLPSICDQQSIVQLIETEIARVDAKIAKTQHIIELQKEYRTALISEVVTGKIKVSHLLDKEMAL
ncbi:MAG: restriction endonuclease subunit S [Methylobacter sp.]|uniref:restriction endonuclease subunit S n=1 Tax=Methylobacter sp. TaxID=2051955 RepID=UPI0027314F34|nr:restriction endonuclease subunit S [Methylobacter sp.]MDP1664437.1 restriction endonuclease subunit S [Methylobacter sp.]